MDKSPGNGPLESRRSWSSPSTGTRAIFVVVVGATIAGAVLLARSPSTEPAPGDPHDAASSTHEVRIPSTTRQIVITWTPVEGAGGYSIGWDTEPSTLPDQTVDLGGEASEAASPRLDDGDWYFHLRTTADGAWTSTIHLGPYPILSQIRPTQSTITEASATSGATVPDAKPTDPPEDPPEEDPSPDLTGMYTFSMTFGEPSGGCGHPAFTDTVILTLNADGTADLVQAQHLSSGTWTTKEGVLMLSLVLETEFPESYTLTSSDGASTLSGVSTYQDGDACITTYQVEAVREG